MVTRIIEPGMAKAIIDAFDYEKMPRAQLIEHCKAYSKAIHDLVRDAQELRNLKARLDKNKKYPRERLIDTNCSR